MQNPRRNSTYWCIALALYSLLWGLPSGLAQFSLTATPTQLYYVVLAVSAVVLLVCSGWSLRRWQAPVLWCCFAAAIVLLLNQTTGLLFGTILCASPG